MLIKRISIYKDFHCTGSDCPVNCCRGWRIPIDDGAYMQYLHQKGAFGFLLRLLIEKRDGLVSFRYAQRGCPFWGPDHLCRIQKRYGTAYMPLVCVQFPRQLFHLGPFCEETLYLACPESARLFLRAAASGTPFTFEESYGEVSYEVGTTNDDTAFLDYLVDARDALIRMLGQGMHFDSGAITAYARDAQDACLRQIHLPDPAGYLNGPWEPYAFGLRDFDRLFYRGFYHPNLKGQSPLLYRLCRTYIRRFGIMHRIDPNASEQKFVSLVTDLGSRLPEIDRLLDRYLEYHLQTDFLDIFEDYSFVKHLTYGIVKAHMLRIFLALYARYGLKKGASFSETELASIIAVFERRVPQIEDAVTAL